MKEYTILMVRYMVLNDTFNNITVILWRSVLLEEETIDQPQVTDALYHNNVISVSSTPRLERDSTPKL